jgi:hypothetical protein
MNIASQHYNTAILRLITLIVLLSFSLASFSHVMHIDVDSQQTETLDCKLCQNNLDDNENQLLVNEKTTVQFTVTPSLNKSFIRYFQLYITPALRAPPIN